MQDKMIGLAYHTIHQHTIMVRALHTLASIASQIDCWTQEPVQAIRTRQETHRRSGTDGQGDPLRHNHRTGGILWCAILVTEARGQERLWPPQEQAVIHTTGSTGEEIMDERLAKKHYQIQLGRRARIQIIRQDIAKELDTWKQAWFTVMEDTCQYRCDLSLEPLAGQRGRSTRLNIGVLGVHVTWPTTEPKEVETRRAQRLALEKHMRCPICKKPMMKEGAGMTQECKAWHIPTKTPWPQVASTGKRRRQESGTRREDAAGSAAARGAREEGGS